MEKINFEDGQKTTSAYVTIDETDYTVTDAVWTGETPLSAYNLNNMQVNIEKAINKKNVEKVTTTSAISENTDYTIPLYYQVGNNSLEVFYMGEKLIKDEHYIEVGTADTFSNVIQFKDWGMSVPVGRMIEFRVKGDYDE